MVRGTGMEECRNSAGKALGKQSCRKYKTTGIFSKQAYCFYLALPDFVGKKTMKTLQGG